MYSSKNRESKETEWRKGGHEEQENKVNKKTWGEGEEAEEEPKWKSEDDDL